MILRDYQRTCVDAVFSQWENANSTLLVVPTGGGKTVIAANVIRRRFPSRTLFIAHRSELIWQAAERIKQATGLNVEVEMGEYKAAPVSGGLFAKAHVIVASVQTLSSGGDGGGRMCKFPPDYFKTIVIDEAHHATAPSYKKPIRYFSFENDCKVLGITATADRADEEALGQVFETVAMTYEMDDAVADGWLVPIKADEICISELDFSNVRTTAGDLNGADLAAVMEAEKPLHGVADATLEIVGSKKTLVFTASVKHAEMLSNIFNRHRPGTSAWVFGGTDKDVRRKINDDFRSGGINILCNCGTHTEGFDAPATEVIVMARPTKSRALYVQMTGRGTRPLPGVVDNIPNSPALRRAAIARSAKPACMVLDFVGNSGRHKLVTAFDILGGKYSEEVIYRALSLARKSGKPVDVAKQLKEEDERERAEKAEKRRLEEEAAKARLTAKAKFTRRSVDPFDVLQLSPAQPRGWDRGKQFAEWQRRLLKKNGIDPDKIAYHLGRQFITEIYRRREGKECTYGQAKVLKKYGLNVHMSFSLASQTIQAIADNGWQVPSVLPSEPAKMESAGYIPPRPVRKDAQTHDDVPF